MTRRNGGGAVRACAYHGGVTGEELRALRVAAGFRTQADLAAALGKSVRTIVNWEADGARVPRKEEARVRQLLMSPHIPSLESFSDIELLTEVGRRLALADRGRVSLPPGEGGTDAHSASTVSGVRVVRTGRRGALHDDV